MPHNCLWKKYCEACGGGKPASGRRVVLELLHKSITPVKNGNYIVEVEASNENLDLEGQRVLQSALLKSKDYFLHNGVISKDHRHKERDKAGNTVYREEFVIGEPVSVNTDGGSVIVKLELYGKNPFAREFIKLLDNNSSRVKASVGGSILEKADGDDGEEIKTVLWDDLALTIAPVNPSLSGAYFSKSITSAALVKSLSKNILRKSVSRLEYFRALIMKHLNEAEKAERTELARELKKARGYPVGTIREWRGRKYIKKPNGKWAPKYEAETKGAKIAIGAVKKKILAARTAQEMMGIVLENRDRFADAEGNPLPFVQELSELVKKQGDKIETLETGKTEYKPVNGITQGVFQKKANIIHKKSSPAEKYAVEKYTGSGYTDINDMYYGNELFLYEKEIELRKKAKNLDKIIKKFILNKDIITHRGTYAKYYEHWKVGNSYRLPAFFSTSVSPDVDFVKYSSFKIELHIKRGTNGMYIGELSECPNEEEFLLGRNLKYKVIAKSDKKMIVEVSDD